MNPEDSKLVDIFMKAQAEPEGRMFSENILAGIKAVLRVSEPRCETPPVAARPETRHESEETSVTFDQWFEGKYPKQVYGEFDDAELIQMRDEYREVWEVAQEQAARPEVRTQEECLGKPARYWYDAFQIAEGLRADAERRVAEGKAGDTERFLWLVAQSASVQDEVLRPPIPPELLEHPEAWLHIVRAAIDSRRAMNPRRE